MAIIVITIISSKRLNALLDKRMAFILLCWFLFGLDQANRIARRA
jgi:hypothetical protein